MTTLDILEDIAIFADLTMEELALIEPLCAVHAGKSGDYLIREGERVSNLYVLLSGRATIKKARADGTMVTIAQALKGDLLGEVTFFKNTPASATVEATTPFQALAIDHKHFHCVLNAHPLLGCKIYRKFARVMSMRIKTQLAQIAAGLSAE